MNKFTFVLLVVVYFLSLIYQSFGHLTVDNQLVFCIALVSLFGIPHGSIDHVLYVSKMKSSKLFFYSFYFGLIFLYVLLWLYFPLHLGITEAGGLMTGTIKSSIGMGSLLWAGLGDTIRVSLSADPVEEIKVGFNILKSLNLRHRGVNVISCPSCARQEFNVIKNVEELEKRLEHISTPMTLSVIGCVVNGPGEARETDIGLTGGKSGHQIYLNGEKHHVLRDKDMIDHLVDLCEKKQKELLKKKA